MTPAVPLTKPLGASPTVRKAGLRPRLAPIVAGTLVALHALLAWLARTPGIATRQDDALHVILARALRAGTYREVFRIDAPPHTLYPPGYSALLAAWGIPGGDAYDWLVLLSVLCSVATLVLVFVAFRRVAGPAVALLALVPLAVNPALLEYAGSISSEAPYTFLATLALFLLGEEKAGRRRLGLACAVAVVAAMTRSVGVSLIAAVLLHLVIERRWRAALAFTAASAATVGAWFLWIASAPEQFVGRSYVADALARPDGRSLLDLLLQRALHRPVTYIGQWLPAAMEFPVLRHSPVDNAVAALTIVVTGAIGVTILLRRWRSAALYVLFYSLILLTWTWAALRFAVPLLPVLLPMMLLGLYTVGERVRRGGGLLAAGVLAVTLAASGVRDTIETIGEVAPCNPVRDMPSPECLKRDQVAYFDALRLIREKLPEDAVIVSMKPEPLYLYTGRRTVLGRVIVRSADQARETMERVGADYILLGSLQGLELSALPRVLMPFCDALAVEAFFPARTWLFRLRQPGEGRDRAGCTALESAIRANVGRNFASDP